MRLTNISFFHKLGMLCVGIVIAGGIIGGGVLGVVFTVFGAGLSSTDVQLSSTATGASSTATMLFTTVGSIPANGKIKVVFPSGFTVSGATGGTCSSMDGTFATSVSSQTVTITRQNDGTEQTAGAETCTINAIVNPVVNGTTGTYTFSTTDGSDVQIDSDASVAGDSITAAALTSVNVEPASLVAGTTNAVTVTFTTINAIENDGKIKVVFPAGFNVSGASGGTCSSMDGAFATTVNSQTVVLVRSGGTSSLPGAQTCTINTIVNPSSAGSTGTYTVQTTNAANQIHDVDANVAADSITAASSALSSTNVQPASLIAGASGTVTIDFTTATTLPANGKIKVVFPSGFTVSGATGGTCSSMDGTFATSVSSQTVTITRQNDGASQSAAAETCTVSGIINPTVAGATSSYAIQTTDGANSVLDADAAVSSDTIAAASLTGTNVEPTALTTGTMGTVTITFTTVNTLESDGKIKIIFPAGFNVNAAGGEACSTMDGSFATSVSGQTVTLTRSGGTGEPAGPQTCTINGIINPSVSGSGGVYAIQTTTAANGIHDIDEAVAADSFTPSSLTGVDVQLLNNFAGALISATVTFTTVSTVAGTDLIAITFPDGFIVNAANSGTCSSMDGSFATSVSGQTVTLTRSGGTTAAPGPHSCSVAGIRNPSVAGTTGTYTVVTAVSGGGLHDRNTMVAADTIAAAPLANANVEPVVRRTNIPALINVLFTTSNALENDGKVVIVFPGGFNVSGATSGACSTMDGAFATQISGQTVTLVRSGGTLASEGAQRCSLSGVITPVSPGLAGLYTISTTDAAGALHEVDTTVTGDIFTNASTNTASPSSSSGESYKITITSPEANTIYKEGDLVSITWNTNESTESPDYVNLWYSTDGGDFWTQIVTNTANDGEYGWTATGENSAQVIVKAEASDLVSVLATDKSDTFTFGLGDVEVPEDTSQEQTGAQEETPQEERVLTVGSFVRTADSSDVYAIEENLVKRRFPDTQTLFTYVNSFDEVETVSADVLATYAEGDLMTPRAGSVLVKVPTDKKVYALDGVGALLRLRWVTSEAVASAIYGTQWADHVIDMLTNVFDQLTVGDDITSPDDVSAQADVPFYTRDELNGH